MSMDSGWIRLGRGLERQFVTFIIVTVFAVTGLMLGLRYATVADADLKTVYKDLFQQWLTALIAITSSIVTFFYAKRES